MGLKASACRRLMSAVDRLPESASSWEGRPTRQSQSAEVRTASTYLLPSGRHQQRGYRTALSCVFAITLNPRSEVK